MIHFSLSLSDEEERWKGREGKKRSMRREWRGPGPGDGFFYMGGPLRTNVGGRGRV